jgi:hypothetical protein
MTERTCFVNLVVLSLVVLSLLLVPVKLTLGQANITTTPTIMTLMSRTASVSAATPITTNSTATFTDETGFTVNLPPGWTLVDLNNTTKETRNAPSISATDYNLLELCPPGQSVLSGSDPFPQKPGCRGYFGSIQIQRYLNLENEESFVSSDNSSRDSKTDRKVSNITAHDIIDYTKHPWDMLVDTKDMPVNVTELSNGTHRQVPGTLALFSTIDEKLKYIGLYFVVEDLDNNNTAGYRVTYSAPAGAEADPSLMWDPRGDPIPIYGIDLENLPPSFEPILQILESVSIQYNS